MGMKTIQLSLTRVGIEALKTYTTFDEQNLVVRTPLVQRCRVFSWGHLTRQSRNVSPNAPIGEKPSETNEDSGCASPRLYCRESLRVDLVEGDV